MVKDAMDLLSAAATVVIVGLVAIGLLCVDLARRELAGPGAVSRHYRALGVAVTAVFVSLVTLRFLALSA
jgi:hypothetical protein